MSSPTPSSLSSSPGIGVPRYRLNGWILAGALLLAATVLSDVFATWAYGSMGSLVSDMVPHLLVAASIVLLAVGWREGPSITARAPLPTIAMLLWAAWSLAAPIFAAITIDAPAMPDAAASWVATDTLVRVVLALIAVVGILRAGVLPEPWSRVPLWCLGIQLLLSVGGWIAVAFLEDHGGASSNPLSFATQLQAVVTFAMTLTLGLLLLILGDRRGAASALAADSAHSAAAERPVARQARPGAARDVWIAWSLAGLLILAGLILGRLGFVYPPLTIPAFSILGVLLTQSGIVLLALGVRGSGSVTGRRLVPTIALILLALWTVAQVGTATLLSGSSSGLGWSLVLVQADVLVRLVLLVIAARGILRAGVVPRPWNQLPMWILAGMALLTLISLVPQLVDSLALPVGLLIAVQGVAGVTAAGSILIAAIALLLGDRARRAATLAA